MMVDVYSEEAGCDRITTEKIVDGTQNRSVFIDRKFYRELYLGLCQTTGESLFFTEYLLIRKSKSKPCSMTIELEEVGSWLVLN